MLPALLRLGGGVDTRWDEEDDAEEERLIEGDGGGKGGLAMECMAGEGGRGGTGGAGRSMGEETLKRIWRC